jgi:hypothetical protein
MTYELWYWAGVPGRGEFIRLACEAGAIGYRDMSRNVDGEALMRDMAGRRPRPYAPPYLVAGDLCILRLAVKKLAMKPWLCSLSVPGQGLIHGTSRTRIT